MKQHHPWVRAAVLLFFVASGATGLVLEVAWTRILGTVFGNTVYAASTVLTVFMLGMALGSALLGRLADHIRRPLMLYGLLEIGVGLYAMLFPLLVTASCAFYAWFYRSLEPGFVLLNLLRFTLSALLLLPPTFLMGGTLPVLGRFLGGRHREPGQEVGYLYGANTFGAVAGCFLAGFVLLEVCGIRGSLLAAGSTALCVGFLAAVLGRRKEAPAEQARPQVAPSPRLKQPQQKKKKKRKKNQHRPSSRLDEPGEPVTGTGLRLVLIALAVTGFCSLAYEVLWTRVLIFVLQTSVYSFAVMLTAFLAGIAVGSFLSARFLVPRLRRPLLWFGLIEVLVGLSALASVAVLARLNVVDLGLARYFTWGGRWQPVLARFADAMAVLFVPTLLMGAAFPIVAVFCLRGKVSLGGRIGKIYAANTIGCVLGAFSAGFVLLPILGTRYSLLAVVALNLAVGVVLIWHSAPAAAWTRSVLAAPVAAIAVAAFALTPSDVFHDTINAFHHPSKLVFLREHSTGTVAVHDLPNGDRVVSVSGVDVAGRDFMLRSTQKLQGYIPLCLHPNPQRVVQIGFGSGETTRVGLEFGVRDYTIVEICPAVFEAGKFFEELNHGSYRDPRLRKIIMDGKNFARLSGEKFDIVMNDSVYPGSSGSSALYTVDHFRNCCERLAEGGLFSCWLPLDLRPAELRMVLKSFQEVFPHTSFWVASNCLNKHALILGSLSRLRIDFARLREVLSRPKVAADLRAVAINDVYDLLDCHVLDEEAIRKLVEMDPINSDDRPRLEFSCAIKAPSEECLKQVLSMLVDSHAPVAPYVVNFIDEAADLTELECRFQATNHIFRAQVAQLIGEPTLRSLELDRAKAVHPREVHVETCQAELQREIRDLEAVLKRYPASSTLVSRLADKYYVAARYPEASYLYEQILEAQSAPAPRVYARLANIHFRFREVAAAEKLLHEGLAAWPNSAEIHDRVAGICLHNGQIELARKHIDEAVRLAPGDWRYLEHRKQITAATP